MAARGIEHVQLELSAIVVMPQLVRPDTVQSGTIAGRE
jgi:hypothetical protein